MFSHLTGKFTETCRVEKTNQNKLCATGANCVGF